MSNDKTIDLDFTMSLELPPDAARHVAQAGRHADDAIKLLEQAAATGQMDAKAWRLLAALYLGVNRTDALKDMEGRYQHDFGLPMFADLPPAKPPVAAAPAVFEMPGKIARGALPDIGAVCAACAEPQGVRLDFSKVRGVGAEGLKELRSFFSMLPRDAGQIELPGIERFVASIEKAIDGGHGSKDLWDMLFEYWRFRGNQDAFDELAIKYAVKTGISPPSW